MTPFNSSDLFIMYCSVESDKFSKGTGSKSNPALQTSKNLQMCPRGYQLKSVLLVAIILISVTAKAQFKKGDKLIGGYFAITTQRSSDQNGIDIQTMKSNSFSLRPFMGVFLNEKWAIGGSLGYSVSYQKNWFSTPDIQTYKNRSFSLGIFSRRYFSISEKFFFMVHGEGSFARGSFITSNVFLEHTSQKYDLGINIRPMFVFVPSPRWGFEGGLGSLSFTHSRFLSTGKKSNFFDMSYGGLSLGVTYYIHRPE